MNSNIIPGEIRAAMLIMALCLFGTELIQFLYDLGMDDLTADFFLTGLGILASSIAISGRIPLVSSDIEASSPDGSAGRSNPPRRIA